jgi:hypothetical protein
VKRISSLLVGSPTVSASLQGHGTLVDLPDDWETLGDVAEEHGFYFSCLYPPYESYERQHFIRCLEEAGPARSHRGQDRSQADFLFALYALSRKRGFDEAEIIAELLTRSEKAAQREQQREGGGRVYVEMTVRAAARVARRNR